MQKKAAIITLGCAKNTVDSEQIASLLREAGVEVCTDPRNAPVALINTCGFIDSAKTESIDAILDIAGLKESCGLESVVVSGCLAERYADDLERDMPEVDFFCGTDVRDAAGAVLKSLALEPGRFPSTVFRSHRFTPAGWAYLRIAEGCDNRCSYCAIPSIRGPLRSRPEGDIISEAGRLLEDGVKEINLIAQDTTAYRREGGKPRLHGLLEKLCREFPEVWIRLLYTHPAHYYEALIEVIADRPQICPYLDMPLQHINDGILTAMGRRVTRAEIEDLIALLRASIPSLVLRTTFMIGFPGEDEEAFEELMCFAKTARFERMGAFIYSAEEGTPAALFPEDVPEQVKRERHHRLMSAQRRIAFDVAAGRLGEITRVLVEADSEIGKDLRVGRSPGEAPEVDPVILLQDAENIEPGQVIEAEITGSEGYDCVATPL